MDGHEQRRRLAVGNAHPIVESNESVVGARHDHAILATLLEAITQCQSKGQHQVFLNLSACLRAVVDTAMARVDHYHWASIWWGHRLRRGRRLLRGRGR